MAQYFFLFTGHLLGMIGCQMYLPKTAQLYFQQLLPLSECNAEDGRVVGCWLAELVESRPDDLAHAIRTFSNRMAMLRECGFRIGAFLVALTAPDQTAESAATVTQGPVSPATTTDEQAAAIGRALRTAIDQALAAAADKTVTFRGPWSPRAAGQSAAPVRAAASSHSVLRTMMSSHLWFLPMLEALFVPAVEPLSAVVGSAIARGRSSTVAPDLCRGPEAFAERSLIDVAKDAEPPQDGGFDSPVRIGSVCPLRSPSEPHGIPDGRRNHRSRSVPSAEG